MPTSTILSQAMRLVRAACLMLLTGSAILIVPSARAADAPARPFLLHLNGIGGHLPCDDAMTAGLRAAGFKGDLQIYDWTGEQKGLVALQAYDRNRKEAKKVAQIITARFRQHPEQPIYLTSHSGGTGLAAWALEDLPEDVKVEAVLMLAPALSPQYDLTRALRHVRRAMYVFSSPHDTVILSAGTKVFGTIDGVHSDAAGLNGFVCPPGADRKEYRKVVPQPYLQEWLKKYGSFGSHVCPMRFNFARDYLATVLFTGRVPETQPALRQRADAGKVLQ